MNMVIVLKLYEILIIESKWILVFIFLLHLD